MKELFLKLVEYWNDDEEVLDLICMAMNRIGNYVQKVYMMEYSQPIYYARYEGAELRDKIMQLDESRKLAHEAAIAAYTAQLNRLCTLAGVGLLYEGDVADRWEVAEFCERMVVEFFGKRSGPRPRTLEEYKTASQEKAC